MSLWGPALTPSRHRGLGERENLPHSSSKFASCGWSPFLHQPQPSTHEGPWFLPRPVSDPRSHSQAMLDAAGQHEQMPVREASALLEGGTTKQPALLFTVPGSPCSYCCDTTPTWPLALHKYKSTKSILPLPWPSLHCWPPCAIRRKVEYLPNRVPKPGQAYGSGEKGVDLPGISRWKWVDT